MREFSLLVFNGGALEHVRCVWKYKRMEFFVTFCFCRTYRFFLPLRKKRKHYLLIFLVCERKMGGARTRPRCLQHMYLHVLEFCVANCLERGKRSLLWCKILSSVITSAMHLMAYSDALRKKLLNIFSPSQKRKVSPSKVFSPQDLKFMHPKYCFGEKFMFTEDYNENDYLYLPEFL